MTRWQRYALIAILALGTVLYGWAMWTGSWGNTYYTAAVKSMSLNLTNFLFGSFDPAGAVTIDKPPLALWPQVISVRIFGFHSWSVLLPQVIEGVAAIFLLHRTVRMWAGENAALIAALVFALTPITVMVTRTNNTDTMLVLTLVAAAYAFTRATKALEPGRRTKWLLFAAFLIGCGFLAKMAAAYVVIPAFFAAYLVGSEAPWRRRALDLAGAAVVLLASSLWWVAAVALWPGRKPYIGGSTDGTALDLVLGYNGLGRVFGGEGTGNAVPATGTPPQGGGGPGGPGGPGGGPGGASFGGEPGSGRMFNEAVGGQISWLLPVAIVTLVVAAVLGFRRWRRSAPADTANRAGWVLWGGWLAVFAVVFSYQKGVFHPYYTIVMAPAIGAIIGAGAVWAFRRYRDPEGLGRFVLPAGVAVTAAWAWVLISRDTSWHGWLRYAVVIVALVAMLALVPHKVPRVGLVLGLVAVLLAPAVWSGAGAVSTTAVASLPAAGPVHDMLPDGWDSGELTEDQREDPGLRQVAFGRSRDHTGGRGRLPVREDRTSSPPTRPSSAWAGSTAATRRPRRTSCPRGCVRASCGSCSPAAGWRTATRSSSGPGGSSRTASRCSPWRATASRPWAVRAARRCTSARPVTLSAFLGSSHVVPR